MLCSQEVFFSCVAVMYPYLISLTSCACQSLHACLVPISSLQSIWKIFFFFIVRGHGWFVSAWRSHASIRTPPSHVNIVCDLLAKSLTSPSHCRPSSCLLYLTPHFSIASDFHTHLSSANTIFLSLCLFVVWQRTAPSHFPLSLADAHMHTKTHMYTLFIFTRQHPIFHCLDITHLRQ